jgi:hypothetical protein
LDFIEKDDDDGKDFVWLDISFELKRTFSTNTFWHITDTNSDNLLELDDRELEMGQRISDLQFKDIIIAAFAVIRKRRVVSYTRESMLCCCY